MKLVVGLGNPGRAYVGTRHNIGWEILDRLAVRLGWIDSPEQFDRQSRSNFNSLSLDGTVRLGGTVGGSSGGSDRKLLLLKPTTYMNDSGRAVQAAAAFYQIAPAELMIVLDDIALPCGRIRLRRGGSSGGHNGLRDVERVLGTQDYPRLRIGIDAPPPRVSWRDYVLTRFSDTQRRALDPAIDRAVYAIVTWIDQGVTAAMNRFNADAEQHKDDADEPNGE
jgi:PTH1 family peptidyl-tRNA hydrolase